MHATRIIIAAAAAILLSACASTPHRTAPPPNPQSPQAGVPDAVPRAEPRGSHGNPPFYDVNGRRYEVRASADNFVERGVASWYGPNFHGHSTSSGEVYDMYAMTAAHRTLPIPCYARVTNLSNGRSVVVRINDRGPFVANRVIDLSYSAASRLDIVRTGTAFVELRTIGPGNEGAVAPPVAVVAATTMSPVAQPAPPVPTGSPVADAAAATIGASPPVAVALYIQIGAFADPANAQHVIDRLQSNGVAHVFSVANDSGGRTLRRVRIGPIATVEEFDALAARLATLGYPEARLAND
jgi:rare lipoprotein A